MNKLVMSLAVLALIGEVSAVNITRKYQWGNQKPSDEYANGDKDDDKELQDEGDPNDDIVDDNGFVRQWDSNQRELGSGKHLPGQFKQWSNIQLASQMGEMPADEVANGDNNENRDLEDEGDANDDIVDDVGFTNSFKTRHELAQKKHHHHIGDDMNIQIDYLMAQHNKFEAVSKLLSIGDDVNSNIGTLPGQTNSGYQSMLPKSYFEQNHIFDGHHIQVPRDDGDQPLRNNAHSMVQLDMYKYSDELANGDSADNRDIHEDEDMNDDVVDYQGQTNAGYGSLLPKTYFEQNHIMEGHHIQVPRDESPMRNNAAQN